jgi:hypothetical protein
MVDLVARAPPSLVDDRDASASMLHAALAGIVQ